MKDHYEELAACFQLLLNRTNEDALLKAANGNVDVVKTAIRWYNLHKETGWLPPGFRTMNILMPHDFWVIEGKVE